jgi:hypothetical protein
MTELYPFSPIKVKASANVMETIASNVGVRKGVLPGGLR